MAFYKARLPVRLFSLFYAPARTNKQPLKGTRSWAEYSGWSKWEHSIEEKKN